MIRYCKYRNCNKVIEGRPNKLYCSGIKLNHYTNLQPLCSKINRDIKKDKLKNEDSRI